jgi:hypothetical protein
MFAIQALELFDRAFNKDEDVRSVLPLLI